MSGSVYSATPHRIAISAPPLHVCCVTVCARAARAGAAGGYSSEIYSVEYMERIFDTRAVSAVTHKTEPTADPCIVLCLASPQRTAERRLDSAGGRPNAKSKDERAARRERSCACAV